MDTNTCREDNIIEISIFIFRIVAISNNSKPLSAKLLEIYELLLNLLLENVTHKLTYF